MNTKLFTTFVPKYNMPYHLSEEMTSMLKNIANVFRTGIVPTIDISKDLTMQYIQFINSVEKHVDAPLVFESREKIDPDDVQVIVDVINWLGANLTGTVHHIYDSLDSEDFYDAIEDDGITTTTV